MDNNLINKKDNNKDIDYNQKANEFEEVLNSLPEQKRELIERTFIGLMAQGNESPEAILAKNFTPDTLRQQLDNLSQQDKFVYKDRQFYKLFVIIIILIVSILFIVIIRMLRDNPDVMEKVIFTIGGVITGMIGGYGLGKSNR